MKHKWHKEIKAWADGAEIERWYWQYDGWGAALNPNWDERYEYRIKPQSKKRISAKELIKQVVDEYNASCDKEPQYLYVYRMAGQHNVEFRLWDTKTDAPTYVGKIKLEVDDAM